MAKKKIKAKKPKSSEKKPVNKKAEKKTKKDDPPQSNLDKAEAQIHALVEKGRKKGHLTYEEMNDELPEELVSPARLDSLLATLDELGVTIIDEADVSKYPKVLEEEDEFEASDENVIITQKKKTKKKDEILEKQLVGTEGTRRIDDPIRMYLTQMGEISLLTRKEEITLARKIELSRMAFRRKMLENEYCANNSVEILMQVHDGTLSFDRTMKISTAENLIRSVIKKRLLENVNTVVALRKKNQVLFKKNFNNEQGLDAKKITFEVTGNFRSRILVVGIDKFGTLRERRINFSNGYISEDR